MAEKVPKKKPREVLTDPMLTRSGPRGGPRLSETLDRVRKYVDKTEFEPVDGVNADALDVVERGALFSNLFQRIRRSKLPVPTGTGPTIPIKIPTDPVRVTLTPEQSAKWDESFKKHNKAGKWSKLSKLSKFLGPLAKKLPGVNAGVLAYETASLINSPEARQKARDQSEEMYRRGDSLEGNLKNMAQGVLDPVGVTFAAGEALADTAKTYGGLAYDKLFGPSEEEQISAARYRSSKRRERRRLERMSPEQKAAREKRLAEQEAYLEKFSSSRRFGTSVNAREEKKNPLTDEQYRLSIPRSRGPYPKS
tara:strand:- start:19242 stop:20165 length:924 start_codon:yes stop_codon:yes gene_type:complete